MTEKKDDTNSGALFAVQQEQELLGQGKLNVKGYDRRIAVISGIDSDGNASTDVYMKIGRIWKQDSDKENAPNSTGQIKVGNTKYRIAIWNNKSDKGVEYRSIKLTENEPDSY